MSLGYGDWYFNGIKNKICLSARIKSEGLWIIWLPTGDQLDEEIIKRIKAKEKISKIYSFTYEIYPSVEKQIYYVAKASFFDHKEDWSRIEMKSTNPLIAKIKLLKQLLK